MTDKIGALSKSLAEIDWQLTHNYNAHKADKCLSSLENRRKAIMTDLEIIEGVLANDRQAQRDHEREMKIIDHEIARENRLAAEATAKVAATAQEQASQSLDGLLKGLQGDEQ